MEMLPSQRALFDMPRDICFLNAAAWSPIPLSAVEAGQKGAASKSRPWDIAPDFADAECERARANAAKLVNAEPDDIALISSVGYGVSTAAKVFHIPAGSRVLVLDSDHSSPTLEWMERAEAGNYTVDVVTPGPERDWTSAVLEAIERPNAPPLALASISSVHWSDGALIDVDRVQAALKKSGAGFLIDATHGAGIMAMDVRSLDPDFVIFPTYKWLLGPYGRAFMYIAKRHQNGVPLEQTSYGRRRVNAEDSQYLSDLNYVEGARRFDMGERDFFVSLGVASHSMEFLQSLGMAVIRARLTMLTSRIAEGLAGVDVEILRSDLRAPHLLCLGFPGGMPDTFAQRLLDQKVYAAPRLGRLRLSPHVYNDEEDCERFCRVLRETLQATR